LHITEAEGFIFDDYIAEHFWRHAEAWFFFQNCGQIRTMKTN